MLRLAELSAKRARSEVHENSDHYSKDQENQPYKRSEHSLFTESSVQPPPARLHLFNNSPDPYARPEPRPARISLNTKEDIAGYSPTSTRLSLNDKTEESQFFPKIVKVPSKSKHSWTEVKQDTDVEQHRVLVYDNETKHMVLLAAANAALGFHSDLMIWDPIQMRFELRQDVKQSTFADYLEYFAHTGSLIRRLIQACEDLYQCNDESESRVAIALACAVEKEVNRIQLESDFTHETQLVQLASALQKTVVAVEALADVIGCSGSRGRLTRVPHAVELVERAYIRACTLDSPMLWRLAVSCLTSWFAQLNFVVGLADPLAIRTYSKESKNLNFPDMFIDFTQDTAILDGNLVPGFVPPKVARVSLQCFDLLCYLSLKGPEALKTVARSPAAAYSLTTRGKVQHRLLDPINLLRAEENTRSSRGTQVTFLNAVASPANKKPLSVQHEIRKALSPVIMQHSFLDRSAKCEFQDELSSFREIVCGLYLLHDGWLWSQLLDLIPSATQPSNKAGLKLKLVAINQLVGVRFGDQVWLAAEQGGLMIKYEPSPIIRALFSPNVLQNYQKVFSRILYLSGYQRTRELAVLGTEIDEACMRIDEALASPTAGLSEVKTAFVAVSQLLH